MSYVDLSAMEIAENTNFTLLTRVDLLVGGHSVSINDGLESTSELVDLVVGWRLLTGLHAIQDGRNSRTTTLLCIWYKKLEVYNYSNK